jgi:hypothetical protein
VIWGKVQRRGVDVNTPKNGSRVGVLCFGGISEIHAELRREYIWGNSDLLFFEDLGGFPREYIEEGGHYVCTLCVLRESFMSMGWVLWTLLTHWEVI